MDHETPAKRTIRRDGWTPERREQFLELLAAGMGAGWACGKVGLSHTAAYNLRRRDVGSAWLPEHVAEVVQAALR